MDDHNIKKGQGVQHHKDKKGFKNSSQRFSRSVHYKNNRVRHVRKIADRTSHHRRRQIQKKAIHLVKKTGFEEEPTIRPSFTCLQKRKNIYGLWRNVSNLCSNKK
jgi:hypothetical protein